MSVPHARRVPPARQLPLSLSLAAALLAGTSFPARAVLDVDDRGPALRAGDFNLRVTNAGIVGNAFPERSFDPSFEFPKWSGQELMQYAALWVGALDEEGLPRVSGGPLLEWRPTPASWDTVREAWHGRIGSRRGEDDDGDGRLDEETLNGRDDDGDGEVDEDLGVVGQQTLAADYTDDRPEAVSYVYPGGEPHRPLGLSVHQEAYAWSWPGATGIAGLSYTVTNHGRETLRDLHLGLFVDLDVRPRGAQVGRSEDAVVRLSFSTTIGKGTSRVFVPGRNYVTQACLTRVDRTLPVVVDRVGDTSLPVVAVLPLDHTRDPLAFIVPSAARAPAREAFRVSVFASDRGSGAGGPPLTDSERYAALAGEWPESPDTHRGDPIVLVSCGPFRILAPGQSLELAVALVAAPGLDSLSVALGNAVFLHSGTELNRLPDAGGPQADWWSTGETGINGHEVCLEPPPGVEFDLDPHCSVKFATPTADPPPSRPVRYRPGQCIWTDADCDVCTGLNGRETVVRWVDPYAVPPAPDFRVAAGDREVRIEWDNLPEILVAAGKAGPAGGRFVGYRLYKLADWRDRSSLLPPRGNWALFAAYGYDTRDSKVLLSAVTDTTLDFARIWYEQPYYPVGRYAVTDTEVLNGFDYLYCVTTVVEVQRVVAGFVRTERYESPIATLFDQRVTPRLTARADAQQVWVVPNPFRAGADWDRPPAYGDRLTRHLDFMGLPRAHCTIRIWTVAGDHVATIEHDGTRGSGQASWDLVSRNGQEVASGIYLFTMESPLGNARGRFVVIR